MAGFWESVLPGGLGAYGYSQMMGDIDKQRNRGQDAIEDLQQGTDQRTQFQPWGVTSSAGTTSSGPDGLSMKTNPYMQAFSNKLLYDASDLTARSMEDPQAREQQIYDRMMGAQQPGMDRQAMEMRERLNRGGRSGIRSGAYGGSPEQLAQALAQGELQNNAMLGAMAQGQSEQQQQYTMGQGLRQDSYVPLQNLMEQTRLGLGNAEMGQRGQLSGADLWSQLGLGGLTNDVNYQNIQGNAFGNMISAGMGLLGGVGQSMDGTSGSFWDKFKGIF